MSRRPTGTLGEVLHEVISHALSGGPETRAELESARARLAGVVTIVVTGRRGAGKTTVVNELFSEHVGEVGYSAEDRPAQFFASDEVDVPAWGVATQVPPSLARNRRVVELPEHLTADGLPRGSWAGGLPADLLVHVSRQPLRSDELELLDRARQEWSLGPLEILVLGTPQPPADVMVASLEELPRRMQAVERLVDARRCKDVMEFLSALADRSDDHVWADRLVDDLERLTLTPQGHVLRERWALEACLTRRADVPTTLRDEVVQLTLGARTTIPEDREALFARAGHWRAQISVLPPLAAETARVVARTLQLDAATVDSGSPAEGVAR